MHLKIVTPFNLFVCFLFYLPKAKLNQPWKPCLLKCRNGGWGPVWGILYQVAPCINACPLPSDFWEWNLLLF